MSQARTIAVSLLAGMLLDELSTRRPIEHDDLRRFAHFLTLADEEGFNINPNAAAVVESGRLLWACAGVLSPGRTSMLVLAPLPAGPSAEPLADAVRLMVGLELGRQASLVQVLLPPAQVAEAKLLAGCGFDRLAELIYLQGPLPATGAESTDVARLGVQKYEPSLEPIFAQVIKASYVNTLDCPGLEGLRSMEDVLAGHRGSGIFRPDLWLLYSQEGQPTGVVLLNEVADRSGQAVELVYMGLVQAGRGQGLGRTMFRHAMSLARRAGYRRIITAVDARNIPALRLYCGQGLSESARRVAYIRTSLTAQAGRDAG